MSQLALHPQISFLKNPSLEFRCTGWREVRGGSGRYRGKGEKAVLSPMFPGLCDLTTSDPTLLFSSH